MTTVGVSGMMLQCAFEGSLSMQDMDFERRPYHKNCDCALHKSKGSVCSNACPQRRNISFSKKWNNGSLRMKVAATSKSSSLPVRDTSTSTRNGESVNGPNSLFHSQ